VIPKFLRGALAGRDFIVFGDGTQTRDFTFVDDTARGILLAGFSDGVAGETINIGSGGEITVNDLAKTVLGVTGSGAAVVHRDPRPGDVLRLCADTRRAQELLGFAPTTSLADGLIALRDWYLARGIDAEALLEQEIVENWQPVQQPAAVG
jgi:UDP-glucose 4-epimerase